MNITFGDASEYAEWAAEMPYAGAIGFGTVYRNDTNLASFGAQLAAAYALDNTSAPAPLASLSYTLTSVNLTDGQLTGSGLITVGGEDNDLCVSGGYSYTPLGFHDHWRIDSITGQTPSGDPLSLTINTNRSATISQLLPGHAASHTFIQLLVNASGLVFTGSNETGDYYELSSCDDLQSASNLTLHLASGATLTLAPVDYIYKNVSACKPPI